MRRFAYSLLTLAVLALTPVSAWAQVMVTIRQAIQPGLVVKRDGKQLKNEPVVYVTKADCDENAKYEFSVRYASSPNVVEAWVGVGSTDCSYTFNRLSAAVSARPACKLVGRSLQSSLDRSISVNAVDLFSIDTLSPDFAQEYGDLDAGSDGASRDDGDASCVEVVNVTYTLFFIPLNQPTNGRANVTYEPSSDVGYGTLAATFTLFTSLPYAPSHLTPRAGTAEIGVRFDPVLATGANTQSRAYFDWGSDDSQPCGSGALVADMPAPYEEKTIEAVTTRTNFATLKDLDIKGIPPNSLVAVSAVTVDPAGNESLLTSPVCVERFASNDFVDACHPKAKCGRGSDSCGVRPAAGTGARGIAMSVLLAAALGLRLRRRT